MENLLGVILCGGESKRMGSDKGLIEINGKTWVKHTAEKLSALNMKVVVSVNEQQVESYSRIFNVEELVIDKIQIHGPLRGLLSVHEKYPSNDILLMACDLVDMDSETIERLINEYKSQNNFDFYVYQDEYAEPFCAIYTSRGLKPILEKATLHSLSKFSFQNVLDEGKTLRLPIINKSSFRNYNAIPGHHQAAGK
jgi:molybdopterin-guanine dinucleotide biosynthesis protein A